MNLVTVMTLFPTAEACFAHLEHLRFRDGAYCPKCRSSQVARKKERGRVGRWNCHACKSSFNVLSGTMFQRTKIPLQKWFLAIAIMVNAKKSVSSCQLARDLEMNQSSAWYMQQRIRSEMARRQQEITLQGIIEADETYIGGKPRKPNKRADDKPAARGRGTKKTAIIGAVQRGGNLIDQVSPDVTGQSILRFIKKHVDPSDSMLFTDEYASYKAVSGTIPHIAINHREQYSHGLVNINTIEGAWSLLKRAWIGTHHHYTERWMPLFVAEAVWKYNKRKSGNAFAEFIQGVFV